MPAPSPWWNSDRHIDRRPFLTARGRIKGAIRAWFEAHGFVEVETGCLQVSPGNETHLHAFATEAVGTDLVRLPLYLHTSPEFAMKKLIAAGETKIFSFAPVFRNRERGPLHAPEFTMLEWYRAGAPYRDLWDDCASLMRIASDVSGRHDWTWKNRSADVRAGPLDLTLDQAFTQYADIALHETYGANGTDRSALAQRARAVGIAFADGDSWADIFSRVLVEKIEPYLGIYRPEILYEYPISEAALARPVPGQPHVAERFELYCCGVELANGFGELTDASTQRANLESQMNEREKIYGERYPIDEDFLNALAHMPPTSGCALGFDRLVMLATGATHIDQVIWTPMG
ncbi:MAG: EF-P lysine aminoacylase EpmA [Hyphomicrobium sp.]